MPRKASLEVRFWEKVRKAGPSECWLWTGNVWKVGYGVIKRIRQETAYAHRISWELAHGPIPPGMLVCHTCDVKTCVNPAHLFIGTDRDNSDDKVRKFRQAHGDMKAVALSSEKVKEIRARAGTESQLALASEYNVHPSTISRVISRKRWIHT